MTTRALPILLSLLVLAGCGETPTGRSQLALVPNPVMAEMGAEAFNQIKQAQPLYRDDRAEALVECVSRRAIEAAADVYPKAAFPDEWEVVVFDDPSPNAFALPGGKIGVHSGLLQVAESDAQLATVIGHEIAHLLADHGNERLTQQLGISAIFLVIGLFTDIQNELLYQALGLGAQLGVVLPFSRAHESEADVMGLEIMATAGFRPDESTELWRNMARAGGGQPPEFLSTHPGHDTRIELLEANMVRAMERYRSAAPATCP